MNSIMKACINYHNVYLPFCLTQIAVAIMTFDITHIEYGGKVSVGHLHPGNQAGDFVQCQAGDAEIIRWVMTNQAIGVHFGSYGDLLCVRSKIKFPSPA